MTINYMGGFHSLLDSFHGLGYSLPDNFVLPSNRFFTPTDEFFAAIDSVHDGRTLVECGAGLGDTSHELAAKGYDVMAIDLLQREGQSESVFIMDALFFPFSTDHFVFACRPDHSGWVEPLKEIAVERTGLFAYVGLERNFERDMWVNADTYAIKFLNVGEEGEHMWVWNQQF